MGSKGSAYRGRVEAGSVGSDQAATEKEVVELIGPGVGEDDDADGRNEAETPATPENTTDAGIRGVGDVKEIEPSAPPPVAEDDEDDRGDGAHEVSDYVNDLLQKAGKQLGEEGYIFVGGLIPYRKTSTGGWEIDTDKETLRISNINEAQSARVSMALMAYLIEEMQGDLAKELGVEAIPGLAGQVPS
jgi:hypothetical protein